MLSRVTAFISRRWSVPHHRFRVHVQRLHGGLESTVARAWISEPAGHNEIPPRVVVKRLPVKLEREADVYELLWRHLDRPPAVRLFGRDAAEHATYLYLEDALASVPWPWIDVHKTGAVCRALARLHDSEALPREKFSWSYETQLAYSAQSTLELAINTREALGHRRWRRVGDLRRVVTALPHIRTRLLSAGTTVIHGDVHPGNVILRGGSAADVVLIDWARARVGSPLEDVASWLHSLGCWEPEARRRHDTLLRIYFDERRNRQRLGPEVRVNYWLASACNGLAGAIRYHLAVLSASRSSEQSCDDSARALTAWQRVMRRAAALLMRMRRRPALRSWPTVRETLAESR